MLSAQKPDLIDRYRHLTGIVMPALAKSVHTGWPVRHDHCFQRIVLDTICGGVWYHYVARPAYRHLDHAQALRAVRLCEDIIAGAVDLADLNRKSLAWRGELRKPATAGAADGAGELLL